MVSGILLAIIAFLWLAHILPHTLQRQSVRSTIRDEKRHYNRQLRPVERRVASLLLPQWLFSKTVRLSLAGVLLAGLVFTVVAAGLALAGVWQPWWMLVGVGAASVGVLSLRRLKLAELARTSPELLPTAQHYPSQSTTVTQSDTHSNDADDDQQSGAEPDPVGGTVSEKTEDDQDAEAELAEGLTGWTPRPVPPPLHALRPAVPAHKRSPKRIKRITRKLMGNQSVEEPTTDKTGTDGH